MPAPKRRGRPPKYATAEEREAARRRTKQDSYQRLRDAGREQRQQQQRPNDASTAQELQIQIDPLSILQQTGPGEDMHATASHTGTQMEGSAARDEGEQRQLLQTNPPFPVEEGVADKPTLPDIASLSINAPLSPANSSLRTQYQSRPRSVVARAIPTIPNDRPILVENNGGAGGDGGIPRQFAEQVGPLAPTQPSSSVPGCTLQSADKVQRVPLLEGDDNTEADTVGGTSGIDAGITPSGDWYGSGGAGVVGPASPLASDSSDSEPIYGGSDDEAGWTRLSYEADEADGADEADEAEWASHETDNRSNSVGDSDDDSNDGTIDRREGRAENSEHAANNQSDELDREQYTRAAAAQLRVAWHERCFCDEPQYAVEEIGYSLAGITRFLQDKVSQFAPRGVVNYPLDLQTIASRNDDPNDHRHIPWQLLLAGGEESPPKLSLLKSERRFKSPDVQICRRWDVDSFIAHAATLAVHRGGFNLAYRPPYLRRITQNQRVRIQGHEVHELKQLRFGQGLVAAGFGYECHVFFPHMAVKDGGGTHLSDGEQAVWVDDIILPALKRSCPPDIYQHHPHSFADADFKAKVKRECFTTVTGQPMDIRYVVPESCLGTFWVEVQRLSHQYTGNGRVPHDAFHNLFLVITGHGLKLFTKRDTFDLARNDFLSHLSLCFNFGEEQIPADDCWLDLGIEDTPFSATDPTRGVTLLRKLHCLDSWVEKFACPDHAAQLIRKRRYHWALTRDSGSANVELRQTNSLRKMGGIAYNKAYNVNKELFATPLKGYDPFQNSQFEALGYSQDLLERWYTINSAKGTRPDAGKRQQLLAAYNATKQRLSSALRRSKDENYGVRQEYRITIELLRKLENVEQLESASEGLPTSSAANSQASSEVTADEEGKHMPYWVLPTKEVNAFAAAELNRWLLCLEVLIGRVSAGHDGRSAASQEEQLINGVMVSAVVRVLRMSTSTDYLLHPSMWLGEWDPEKRRRVREVSDDDTEGDSGDGTRHRTKKFGLDLRRCVRENGMAWFPVEPIHWNVIPTFTSQAIKRLALVSNAFQKSFHKTQNIRSLLLREDTMLRLFRECLRTAPETAAIKVGAQLSIQGYIQEVLALLAGRWADGPRKPKERLDAFVTMAKLEDEEASGLRGLTYVMVANLIGCPPRVVGVRRSKARGKARNGKAHFAQYDTGLWKDKVFAVFAWDDERAGVTKKRGWHNAAFRVLTRRLHSIVVEEVGEEGGHVFLAYIKDYAARYLWIIPQYDYDKLSVMYKASKHHSQEAQEEIGSLSPLERTNWIVPQMSAEYQSDFRAIREHYGQGRQRLDRARWKEARNKLAIGLNVSRLEVYSSEDSVDRIPREPGHFGKRVELGRAADFMDALDEHIAREETESEESTE